MTGGLTIDGLTVERGGRRILDGVAFSVPPGTVYALLGGNGAGKSTTLSAILGLLPTQGGSIDVCGQDPARSPAAVRAACTYLAENVALYGHLSARENIQYLLSIAGRRPPAAEVEEAFAAVRLDRDAWDRRVGTFSKGMRQKTAIALALLRRTPVLLLDEPTSGLDPRGTRDFHLLVDEVRNRGVAVLMVTHDLLGAADLADRIGLLEGGRIAQEWRAASTSPRFELEALRAATSGGAAA